MNSMASRSGRGESPLKSGVIRIYLLVTLISILVLAHLSGMFWFSVKTGGIIGLVVAILVNELTTGYTMQGTAIDGRRE